MNLHNESTRTPLDEVWTCLDVDFGAISHQGLVRESNQDSFLVMKFGRSLENLLTNLDEDLFEQNYLMNGYGMLVADGMGGMAGGDVVSGLLSDARRDPDVAAVVLRVDSPGGSVFAAIERATAAAVQDEESERKLQSDHPLEEDPEYKAFVDRNLERLLRQGDLGVKE